VKLPSEPVTARVETSPEEAEPSTLPPAPNNASSVKSGKSSEKEKKIPIAMDVGDSEESQDTISEDRAQQSAGEDYRLNFIDIRIATGVVAHRAESTSSYRQYGLASPSVDMDAEIWLKPDIGIDLNYSTSLNASLSKVTTESDRMAASMQNFGVGLVLRHMYSYDPNSPLLIYSMKQNTYRLIVPSDTSERLRSESSGVVLAARVLTPRESGKFWEWGVELAPSLRHSEEATGLIAKSGNQVEASSVAFLFGSHHRFSREQSFFWRLRFRYEVDQFVGSATVIDPKSGVAPLNVSVEQMFFNFVMGMSWGQ
jgi:hypothetical protein